MISVPSFVLSAPIRRVLVMEDRAQVTRRGEMELPQGLCRVVVPGVTPLAWDRSLRVQRDKDAIQILEFQIHRKADKRLGPEMSLAVELEAQKLVAKEEIDKRQAEEKRIAHRLSRYHDLRRYLREAICREAGLDQADPERWKADLERLLQGALEEALSLPPRERKTAELRADLDALARRYAQSLQPEPEVTARLEALLDVAEACEASITWEYLVPCALWRPSHQAELLVSKEKARGAESKTAEKPREGGEGEGTIRWEASAVIWQKTGEDWKEIALACSTARTTQATNPPLLCDEILSSRKKTTEERQTIVTSLRAEAIQKTGKVGGSGPSEIPGVDDGGETRHFEARHPATIPSHGKPLRVPLFSWEAKAEVGLVCAPELRPAIFLRSMQTNPSTQPLLAGPVHLIQESGYVGRWQIRYVAPQENFPLGWGTQDESRIVRTVEVSSELAAFSGRQNVLRIVRLFVSNLSSKVQRLRVSERIPVSEVEQIEITVRSKATKAEDIVTFPLPTETDERDGLLHWDLSLAPHAHEKITLVLVVQAASNVQLPSEILLV